jgi:hypothetical protein
MTDMQHLTGDALVDLVEGLVSDADVPHLASCDRCRDQLAGLRAARAMAAEKEAVEVPEPSPLFWDHFSARVRAATDAEAIRPLSWWDRTSARVREAVASEPPPTDGWWRRVWSWPGVMAPISAVAAVVVVLAVVFRPAAPATPAQIAAAPSNSSSNVGNVAGATAGYSLELLGDGIAADDASLALVGDLTDDIGLEAAAEAGLASNGSAEHAVTHMSAAELEQLERLLTEEMRRKGA